MSSQNQSLGEAARLYLATLAPEERQISQQEIYRFVRWYGADRPVSALTAPEVANYAERLSLSDKDYVKKLEQIKVFLLFARKEGWLKSNLAIHLKPRKGKTKSQSGAKSAVETVTLTQQGYDELKAELEILKGKRLESINEIRRAAADKDFRENAPLEAAREEHGQLTGRIRALEEIMKSSVIVNADQPSPSALKVGRGDRVVLEDLASGEELRYTIVSPREVEPAHAKISNVSPVGKAVMGQKQGQVVEVVTPAGKLRYRIKLVEH